MPINKAKKHFLGSDGHERLNCAGAIIKAFTELDPKDKDLICKGGGRAPNGECGAYAAAKFILEKGYSEKLEDFREHFIDMAGSTKCREIRKLKKIGCLGCVEKAAEYLHSQHPVK